MLHSSKGQWDGHLRTVNCTLALGSYVRELPQPRGLLGQDLSLGGATQSAP